MTAMTTLKVPISQRDRLRARAATQHKTQAEVIEDLLDLAERCEFLAEIATYQPDEEYLREAREWDNADLAPTLREYQV